MSDSSRIKSAEEAIERARSQIDFKKAENYGTSVDCSDIVTHFDCLFA